MNDGAKKLLTALKNYEQTDSPERYLLNLLERNAQSAFGKEHNFQEIKSIADFRDRVPVRRYEELEPWIAGSLNGESSVLTQEPVIGFELTSGSEGSQKIIPWTESYRAELAGALQKWMSGWEKWKPEILEGQAYWSVSPGFDNGRKSAGGIPIGMEGDASYFPDDVAEALGTWLVDVQGEREGFFDRTIERLAKANLSLVSVWSPTFFLRLDEAFQRSFGKETWKDQWPALSIVSCWTDAQSGAWKSEVEDRSGVEVEAKGLVATEGVTSVPWKGTRAIATGIHFQEFLSLRTGDICCEDEMISGENYEVLLTTGAGLWRYRTDDVLVLDQTGDVSFLGRRSGACDLVGEKVTEAGIVAVFANCKQRGFVAVNEKSRVYKIFSECGSEDLRVALLKNPYFRQAVELGQLKIETETLPNDWMARWEHWQINAKGTRAGDVKPPVLLKGIRQQEIKKWLK